MTDPRPGRVLISSDQLQQRVEELAAEISRDYDGRELLVVGVLKGAVFFIADLLRAMSIPCKLDFMAVSSYGSSTHSSGVVRILKDLDYPIAGRHVLLVEDVIDSGLTLKYLIRNLRSREPESLEICSLLTKPRHRSLPKAPRYVGFDLPDVFVVGYGLDYDESFRDLDHLAELEGVA